MSERYSLSDQTNLVIAQTPGLAVHYIMRPLLRITCQRGHPCADLHGTEFSFEISMCHTSTMGNRLQHSMLVCRYSLKTTAYLEPRTASMLTITIRYSKTCPPRSLHTFTPIATRPWSTGTCSVRSMLSSSCRLIYLRGSTASITIPEHALLDEDGNITCLRMLTISYANLCARTSQTPMSDAV
jgi:hypothetical protein